jgi:hypothetical protein
MPCEVVCDVGTATWLNWYARSLTRSVPDAGPLATPQNGMVASAAAVTVIVSVRNGGVATPVAVPEV